MSVRRRIVKRGGLWCGFAILAMVAMSNGCGGGAKEEEEEFEDPGAKWDATHFTAMPDAKTFYGPTPFTVEFFTEPKNGKGNIRYEWDFRDGTKSDERAPVHTFTKPGLYTVGLAATDETGDVDGGSVIVRAMTDDEVAKMKASQKAPATQPN